MHFAFHLFPVVDKKPRASHMLGYAVPLSYTQPVVSQVWHPAVVPVLTARREIEAGSSLETMDWRPA